MVKKLEMQQPVSVNNPCPFLRALVASGKLADAREPLAKVAAVVAAAASAGDGQPVLPRAAIYAIASVGNGLGPGALLEAQLHGLQLNALRGGPLDKKGVGSGILDTHGGIDASELARLAEFATEHLPHDGAAEPGLDLAALTTYMDANFERAAGRSRYIDRTLMVGEWPVLLKVMGREGRAGRYLSLQEVTDLFVRGRFPARMTQRMP